MSTHRRRKWAYHGTQTHRVDEDALAHRKPWVPPWQQPQPPKPLIDVEAGIRARGLDPHSFISEHEDAGFFYASSTSGGSEMVGEELLLRFPFPERVAENDHIDVPEGHPDYRPGEYRTVERVPPELIEKWDFARRRFIPLVPRAPRKRRSP